MSKTRVSEMLESLCRKFCASAEQNDIIIESLFREKIKNLELPQKLNEFSEIEISALEKIVLNDIHEWAPYRGDFAFIKKQKPEIWKWLIISLSYTALTKRREKNLKLLGSDGDTRWLDDPIGIIEDHYGFVVSYINRKGKSEPRGKIKHPDTSSEWWKPMTKSDMVWATGTYPSKIRGFLSSIKAKPTNKPKGRRGAYFSIETNLLVLDEWLSVWVDDRQASKYANQISIFLDIDIKKMEFERWKKLGIPEKFLPMNKANVSSTELPHIPSLKKILSKFQSHTST